MSLETILLGWIPEIIFFSLFYLYTKDINEKKGLFIFYNALSYICLKLIFSFSAWFNFLYFVLFYIIVKALYYDKAKIVDIFLMAMASIIIIIISTFTYFTLGKWYFLSAIVNRIILFIILFVFKNKFNNIYQVYLKYWDRNRKEKAKIKSLTMRNINVIFFNVMLYIINIGMIFALTVQNRK